MEYSIKPIAYIRTDYPEKFGIPRQSGLVTGLPAYIEFEAEYKNPEAFRGLEGYSHIWLMWVFSENADADWPVTVRPPRLGGNKRVGVFASRSPYHPNHIGLSLVRLIRIEQDKILGPVIIVDGADLMDGTPIIDIKPYLPYCEAIPDAKGGFAEEVKDQTLTVIIPEKLLLMIPDDKREPLKSILSQNPKPGYQADPKREYGLSFAGMNIKFRIEGKTLTVEGISLKKCDCGKNEKK